MSELSMHDRILIIPGVEGFWKVSTESVFLTTANKLSEAGMNDDSVVEILSDIYNAVSHEFGC